MLQANLDKIINGLKDRRAWSKTKACRTEVKKANKEGCEAHDRLLEKLWAQTSNERYFIVYKDGSYVRICAASILMGEDFPKLTGIVYAEFSNDFGHFDTEVEDSMAVEDYDWYMDGIWAKYVRRY